MGAGLVAVRMRLEGAPESLYCVGRSCISWQLVPVPDGLGEERISEGLTARSFLIKASFASSPAVVGLDILLLFYISELKKHPQHNVIKEFIDIHIDGV